MIHHRRIVSRDYIWRQQKAGIPRHDRDSGLKPRDYTGNFGLKVGEDSETWRRTRRKRLIQQIDIRERADGTPTSGKTIEIQLASWLVEQLDARTVAAIAWQVMRRLTGLSKRLAIHLAAQSRLFEPLTAHSERLLIALSDEFYEAMGITSVRERDRRSSVDRAAQRIVAHDPRYSRAVLERTPDGYALRIDRPRGVDILPLPFRAAAGQRVVDEPSQG